MKKIKEVEITICDCCQREIVPYSGPVTNMTSLFEQGSIYKVHDKELCYNCKTTIAGELIIKEGDIKEEFNKIFNKHHNTIINSHRFTFPDSWNITLLNDIYSDGCMAEMQQLNHKE